MRQLLQALSQLAYEVDLLTFPVGQTIEIPGVRYVRCSNPFRVRRVPIGLSIAKILLDVPLIAELSRRLASGLYGYVHAVEEAAFPAVALGRRFQVPVIYDMQSSLPEQLARHLLFRNRMAQTGLRSMEGWLLRRADSVVSSAGLAARVRSAVPHARVREWQYAGTLPQAVAEDVKALRADLGIAPGRPIVLYSGTFEPYQGLPELLAAIPLIQAEVADVTFVLVGAEEKGGTAIGSRHVELIRSGALRIVKRQPRERIPSFLALADVAVSPRAFGDNLPLKVFDYLMSGRPIVATDIPAHRSVLDEERALLTGTSAPALARGVVRLLQDRPLAARLGAAGRLYAEERFGWFTFVRSVGELYRGVNGVAAAA